MVLTTPVKSSNNCALELRLKEKYRHGNCWYLTYDGKRLKWTASYELLKVFVDQTIELKGKWTSPGGSSKKFVCNGSDTTLTWYPGKQNTLTLHGESSTVLFNAMIKTCQLIMNDALLKTNIEAESTDLGNTKEIFETIVKIKTMSEEEDPASDCSILRDLEDFIDQSFQNMEVSSQGVNDNISVVQTIESSTPVQTRAEKCSGIIAKEFSSFKEKTEIEFAALRAKLFEQNDIIYNSEQKLCKLINENLHLKSRIDDLEKEVSLKDKPAVQIDLAKSEQSPNLNNNNSSINLIDTPTPREINKMPLDDNQQPISSSINDFDLKIINLSPAKQPSTPQPKEHLPSNRTKGVSTSANRISPPKSKLTTKKTKNDQHNLAPKSSTFCPFLKRNGRCLKGNRCDFLHPKRSPARKHQTLCPFLQKRGFCLKGDACDFSHIKLHTPENTLKQSLQNPFLTYRQAPEIRYINPISLLPLQNYHQQTWQTLPPSQSVPPLRPLMDIAVPPPYPRFRPF